MDVCFLLMNSMSYSRWIVSHRSSPHSKTDTYDRKGKELLKSSSLSTRKWNRSETMRTVNMSQTIRDSASDSFSTVDSDEGNNGEPTKLVVPLGTPAKAEQQQQSKQSTKSLPHAPDIKHLYECQICSVDFRDNDDIYTSNNPKCNHHFHQSCMEKWLNYQYTCPVCHEIFALQSF